MQSSIQNNPFQTVKPAKKRTDEESGDEDQAGEVSAMAKVVKVRWSDVKEISPASSESPWRLSIEAPAQPAAPKNQAISLPDKRDFFEATKALAINPVCRRAVVGYLWENAESEKQVRLVLCDLEQGKVLSKCFGSGKMSPLALNDAGTEVLMRRSEFGHGNLDRLETWEIGDSEAKKRLQWIPHDDQKSGERDIKWARYIGEDKLVTASGGGKLTVWNSKTATPLYWLKIDGACFPALSPERKYLAFAAEKEIGILDLAAGEVVAMEAAPKDRLPFPIFAFTPKGTRLVCASFDRIYVWDLATGALFRDIPLSGSMVNIGENVVCPSEELVLVGTGNSLLIDIEAQAKLWSYGGHELIGIMNGVCWFVVPGDKSAGLVSATLPQPSAVQKIQKAISAPDFYVLQPGATVKLNVGGLPDPGERVKASTALTKAIQANGCQVGPTGAVEVTALVEPGARRELAYHSFGRPGSRAYPFQEYMCRVKIMYQGQTAWEVSCSNTPGMVRLKENQTMEQYLKTCEHPNYEWFSKVELPKVVQKPSAGNTTLGTTQVTTAGVR